ncbi:MFS transporter [Prolixibacteraceae bacterium Z1-6]|uniref:MFS transporter n=1 Tax=Draconibacterium aestuarii TaxID=2998507 RepID=A0A9X3J7J2_9BACT|nr:MFS transporter [Prolixibacteraceae bacterium Z1-6]
MSEKQKIGNYRWRIVVLLFFATTINYIDRQVLGILAPELQNLFNWSESDYGFIIMAFQIAYAIGLLTTGSILDRIGTKRGFSIAIILWSLAGMAHAAARSVFTFAVSRFALGIGESANFPAAVKTVAEWFPKKERALATGIFNSGPNVGAILTPLVIPIIALNWGWKWAFISTGLLGFVWLIFWLVTYRRPEENPKLSAAEKAFILQDGEETTGQTISWKQIIGHKQTLGICLARFVTDPVWWFFLYWLPKFLNSNYGIDLTNIGLPLVTIYVISIGGSILGGWISSQLINKGKNPVSARKITILMMAVLVVPIYFVSGISNMWLAVLFISMAAFAHQGYAANIFTLVSDLYPKNAVGSVVGLSGFAGAIGGVLFSAAVGLILEFSGSYHVVFGIASVAYLVCWAVLKIFVPDSELIEIRS